MRRAKQALCGVLWTEKRISPEQSKFGLRVSDCMQPYLCDAYGIICARNLTWHGTTNPTKEKNMKRLVLTALMAVLVISAALGAVFTENFDGVTAPNLPDGWAIENVNGDAYTWMTSSSYSHSGPNSLYIRYNTSQAMNDWVFSSGVGLTGGTSYTISFWYRNSGTSYPEKLALYYGTAQNAAGMETLIVDLGAFASSLYLKSSSIFTPTENGTYYFGWHGYSNADMFYMCVDDVTIDLAPTEPIFSIDPDTWNFVDAEVGSTASKTFEVSNVGSGSLGIVSIAKTAGDVNYFEITYNTYSDPLEPGDDFTFDVEFTPDAATDYSVTITITDDQTRTAHDLVVTGNGLVRPPGSTCQNPLPVTLPLVGFTGDTGLYGNDYSNTWVTPASSYLNGDDMVLQFTLDGPSTLTGTLTGLQGANWIGMLVVDRCPNPSNPAPVLAIATSSSGSTATLSSSAELPAGSYFLILSSWPTPQSYLFSLDFDAITVATNPELTLKDTSWDFGIAKIDDSNCTPHIFKAISTGNVPATIGAPPQISTGEFIIIEDNNQYPLVLNVYDEASWTVKFIPTGQCGEKTAQMSFQDDAKKTIALIPATKGNIETSILKNQNDKSKAGLFDLQSPQQAENQAKEVHSIALRGFGAKETEEDYFETYEDFVLDFLPWTQYDGDESETYAITNTYFPNEGYTGSFIIFNSSQTSPPITLDAWKAYSGDKMAGCFPAIMPIYGGSGPNNDWLIRGFSYCGPARFSFFAKSITDAYGLERMKILYSYQGDDPEEDYWEYLLGDENTYAEVPVDWTTYEYDLETVLHPTTVYIAIQSVSNDAFVLFVDDFVFGYCDDICPVTLSSFSATVTAQNYVQLNWVSQSESQMLGYRVYRNTNSDQAGAILTDHAMIPATNTSNAQSYSLVDTEVEFGNTYYYWLEAVDFNSSEFYGPVSVILEGTVPPVLPEITSMGNAYPNPFKSNTNIQIDVKANETGTLSIYNIQGQLVRSYEVREGTHNLGWDSRDNAGNICSSGIYFYRLSTPSFKQTRKFMKIK